MATASVQKQRRRAKANARRFAEAVGSVNVVAPPRAKTVRRKTGLEWLLAQKRIVQAQFVAGERYGRAYRASQLAGGCCIKSAMDILDGGGSGGSKLAPGRIDYSAAEGAFAALQEIEAIHALSDNDTDAVAVLAAICGKQFTPMEASGGHRRAADEIEAVLKPLLNGMIVYYRKLDDNGRARAA